MISYSPDRLEQAAKAIGKQPHLEALRQHLPEILEPDVDNSISTAGKSPLRAAVSNLERGSRIREILPYFRYHKMLGDNLDVIFANELDCGMARTGNRHITRELALELGMNYAYGVEFVTAAAYRDGNEAGLHGNAILSRFPMSRVKIVHLPIQYEWFHRKGDCRLGTRMAVLAEIEAGEAGRIGLVCAHLENRATPQGRAAQLAFLMDEVDAHFGNIPILMGGDMNTNTVDGDSPSQMDHLSDHPEEQWERIGQIPKWEPQLDYAKSRGYSYEDCNLLAKPTRRKPMADGRTVLLNLDWFFQRGLRCSDPARVETLFHCDGLRDAPEEVLQYQGQELSDHDIVLVSCAGRPS